MLSPHAIYFIIVDHWERRHQWSIGDVQDLTEALIAASYADRAEHAKAIQLRAQFQVEAARRWGLAPGHESRLFSRDLKLDPYTILPKAWFTSVLNEFLPNLETSHFPMAGGKEVRRHSEHTLPTGTVLENDVAAVVRLGVPPSLAGKLAVELGITMARFDDQSVRSWSERIRNVYCEMGLNVGATSGVETRAACSQCQGMASSLYIARQRDGATAEKIIAKVAMEQAAVAMGLQSCKCDKAAPHSAECKESQRKEAEYQRKLAAELQKDFGTRGIPLCTASQIFSKPNPLEQNQIRRGIIVL